MARLEDSIKNIVELFVEYADGDGKLNKDELKNMMEKEIQNPELKVRLTCNCHPVFFHWHTFTQTFCKMQSKIAAGDFEKAMGRMDRNRDGEINFREFLMCLSFMAKCYYQKKTGKGRDDDEWIKKEKPLDKMQLKALYSSESVKKVFS